MTVVAKVWIDEDCITCDACQDIAPEVFEVTDETSQILAAVRLDGGFDRNEGMSPLSGDFGTQYADIILEAAEAAEHIGVGTALIGPCMDSVIIPT